MADRAIGAIIKHSDFKAKCKTSFEQHKENVERDFAELERIIGGKIVVVDIFLKENRYQSAILIVVKCSTSVEGKVISIPHAS